jgi:hypothetical protein
MNLKATKKTKVITENTLIQKDGYNSLELINIGDDEIVVDDNIPLTVGGSYSWTNYPGVVIDQSTQIRYKTTVNPKLLVIMYYLD